MKIHDMRQEYAKRGLHESEVCSDPISQFRAWFAEAVAAPASDGFEPNGMTLSTLGSGGGPASRIVLLKDITDAGFTFFTNYRSDKGMQIAADAHVALCFWWPPLEREVRIEGTATKTARHVSEQYFASRPRSSQLGALASAQSTVIPGRAALEASLAELEKTYAGRDIPCPEHWGGYIVAPTMAEFWQGRPSRLHDRLRYTQSPDGTWRIERLSP